MYAVFLISNLNSKMMDLGLYQAEPTHTSLKSLPALDTLMWSAQSQRLVTNLDKTGADSNLHFSSNSRSAPLDKLSFHNNRTELSQFGHDTTFATIATCGGSTKDLSMTPRSRALSVAKQPSRSEGTQFMPGRTTLDEIAASPFDMTVDADGCYAFRGSQVCDRGCSPVMEVQKYSQMCRVVSFTDMLSYVPLLTEI